MLIVWLEFVLHVLCVFQGCEAGQGHTELEGLQQENEALRAQMTRLSTQLLEVPTFLILLFLFSFLCIGLCYLNWAFL